MEPILEHHILTKRRADSISNHAVPPSKHRRNGFDGLLNRWPIMIVAGSIAIVTAIRLLLLLEWCIVSTTATVLVVFTMGTAAVAAVTPALTGCGTLVRV